VNEQYARLYTKLYGLETIGLRYFNVFGRRQNPEGAYAAVIPKFIRNLMAGNPVTINGDGLQSRDFTYIENVIEANLKACLASPEASVERLILLMVAVKLFSMCIMKLMPLCKQK